MTKTKRTPKRSVVPNEELELLATSPTQKGGIGIHLANQLWEGLNTPTSLGLYLCGKYGDWASVVNHDVDPARYLNAQDLAYDLQAVKFLSKCEGLPTGIDLEAAARQTLTLCELKNASENEFWREYDCGRLELVPEMEKVLNRARQVIAQILGDLDVAEVEQYCRLGPGLTAFGSKSRIDYHKLSDDPAVTIEAEAIAAPLITSFQGWYDGLTYAGNFPLKVKVVKGGKYTQVPKSSKTNRNIETQPSINLFLQLAFGEVMRRRLRSVGINLDDQSANQRAAHKGSVTGQLATIDLSNASDSISAGVVAALLPPRWYAALNLIRTRRMYDSGVWTELHRFSSMGNGYTFELETLLFLSLCKAVCGNSATVLVYGDDIIVPSRDYDKVCQVLKWFGFTPNPRKSFGTGLFRESCGKDYFNGILVRPFYLKGEPLDATEVIRVANGLSRAARRRGNNRDVDRRYRQSILAAHKIIPSNLRRILAVGWPEDDSFLCGSFYRTGARLVLVREQRAPTQWYAGKTAVLYRLHVRYLAGTQDSCSTLMLLSRNLKDNIRLLRVAPEVRVADGSSADSSRFLLLPSRGEVRKERELGGEIRLETNFNPERVDRDWGLEGPPWVGFT